MEATPEEANVAAKLFKIFNIVVCNANLKSFELKLEVEDRILDDIQSLEHDKDDPDFLPPKSKKIKVSTPSLEQMKKAVDGYDSASSTKIKAARRACSLVPENGYLTIQRWRDLLSKGGSTQEKYAVIREHILTKYREARNSRRAVHESDLQKWAVSKAVLLGLPIFQASHTYISNLKRSLHITSRKITKHITHRELNQQPLEESITNFISIAKEKLVNYNLDFVFNTDQSGYNYEMVSTRTLSDEGEKITEELVNSINKVTHSYSIQVTVTASGKIVGPVFLVLQEVSGQFGPRVSANLPQFQNVYIDCTKSGKFTKKLFQDYCGLLSCEIEEKALLIKDSWSGQSDSKIFREEFGDSVDVLTIPPKVTGKVQPLDVFFFGQWKKFFRKASEYVRLYEITIDITLRENVIKMHSLIHNQISSPVFVPMIKYAWQKSGYIENEVDRFQSVCQVCFKFKGSACSHSECINIAFVCCSWCRELLCFQHFSYGFSCS